jgi:type II secretory pathway component GspD/PulD (secretin)
LDAVERALQKMMASPAGEETPEDTTGFPQPSPISPQINIKAKFVEIDVSKDKEALTRSLVNLPVNTNSVQIIDARTLFESSVKSLEKVYEQLKLPFSTNVTDAATNAQTARAGTLTDGQFKVVLRLLDQLSGVSLLAAPEVTTISDRQAQMQMVQIKQIVTGVTNSDYAITPVSLGPMLDVVPHLMPDGNSVQLAVIPTVTEFIGYDDPGQFAPAGNLVTPAENVLPLPRFRLRLITSSATVRDGETLVLVGGDVVDKERFKDKVPVLGDLPLMGKLFRSESVYNKTKRLLIFVTVTLLDTNGNRLHTD